MPHEVGWHMEGCPCGNGRVQMTPIRYLTECLRPRFENNSGLTNFEKTIRLDTNEIQSSELVQQWDGMQLHYRHDFANQREPLVCPYNNPSGTSEHDDYLHQLMPTGFYSIRFQHPYAKEYYETEAQRLGRVFNALDQGIDLRPYIFFGHWHAERDMCPCWNPSDRASYRRVFNENEEDSRTKNAIILMDTQGSVQPQIGETRPTEGNRSIRAFTRIESDTFPNSVQPSLFVESKRSAEDYTVYEEWMVFGQSDAPGALSFNRKFVLVIPETSIDGIRRFYHLKTNPKYGHGGRTTGSSGNIGARLSSPFTAHTIQWQCVCSMISLRIMVVKGSLITIDVSLHALEWTTGEVLGSTPDGSLFSHKQRRMKLLITNLEKG